MKAASKIFRIFVVGMAIMSSLLVSLPKVHAENEQGNYEIIYWVDQELVSAVWDETFSIYRYAYNVRIHAYCNDPSVVQYVSLTYTNGQGLQKAAGITCANGYSTSVVDSYTSNGTSPLAMGIVINRASLSSSGSVQTEVVSLSDDTINAIVSSFSSIDDQIDKISWVDINSTFNGFSNELNGTYTIPDSSGTLSPLFVSFSNPNIIYDQSAIYKVTIPYTILKSRTGKMTLYVADQEASADFFWYNNARKLEIYIYNIYSSSNLRNLKIKIESLAANKNVQYYPYSTYQFKVEMLSSNDIEYWTLLSYFEQNNVNDDLNDENNDLSNSVDNYVQTEDNLIDDFDTAITDNAVDPLQLPNSNPGNWGTGFTGSLGLIGHVFNQLTASATGGNAVYLLMNFSLMLGLALLIIGKRG